MNVQTENSKNKKLKNKLVKLRKTLAMSISHNLSTEEKEMVDEQVLRMRFPVDGSKGMTYKEIAKQLKLSVKSVRNICLPHTHHVIGDHMYVSVLPTRK